MADLIQRGLERCAEGSLLAFLPGEGEIRRVTHAALAGRLPGNVRSGAPLRRNALQAAQQKPLMRPAPQGRAQGGAGDGHCRNLADAPRYPDCRGWWPCAARGLFDPGSSSLSRLVTERVTRAEATQRAGRAGPRGRRRLLTSSGRKGEDGALAAFPPPEIDAGDLTGFALELAIWGTAPDALRFVTPPHSGRMSEARAVLRMLGALDGEGRVTDHGRALARVPLHPRLAHMLQAGGKGAADMAAMLAERDILSGQGTDLGLRLRALKRPEDFGGAVNRAGLARIRQEAKRLARAAPSGGDHSPAALAALAYPDRVGLRRNGETPRYLLSGGKGAVLPEGDALAGQRIIVATDLDGDAREARIRQAIAIAESEVRGLFAQQIGWVETCAWSRREGRVIARRQERFGVIALDDRSWPDAPADAVAQAMLDGVRQLGLLPSAGAARFLARARLMSDGFRISARRL